MNTKSKSTQWASGIWGCILGGFTGALFLPGVTWLLFYFNQPVSQTSSSSAASDVIGFAIYFIWVIGAIGGAVLGGVFGAVLGWLCGRCFGLWGATVAGVVAGLLSYPSGHLLLLLWLWWVSR